MYIFEQDTLISWETLDVSLMQIQQDLLGSEVSPAPSYALIKDAQRLWFVAHHHQKPLIHPDAKEGAFQAELWKYDVAECFIANPQSGRYLELNLSPNGAWWSCEFTAPRVRADEQDVPFPGVQTYSQMNDGEWLVAMSIPLEALRDRLQFGDKTTCNVTFIINSPEQRFLSAVPLESPEPNYHLPDQFSPLFVIEC